LTGQSDPLARFAAVNGSVEAVPSGRKKGVLDLHFQSTRTFGTVCAREKKGGTPLCTTAFRLKPCNPC
jgi:hypothetical protein